MTFLLPAALVRFFWTVPAPIDAISLPDRPEWERDLARQRGLSEIQRGTQDNLLHFQQTKRLPPSDTGYAFTFTRKR